MASCQRPREEIQARRAGSSRNDLKVKHAHLEETLKGFREENKVQSGQMTCLQGLRARMFWGEGAMQAPRGWGGERHTAEQGDRDQKRRETSSCLPSGWGLSATRALLLTSIPEALMLQSPPSW